VKHVVVAVTAGRTRLEILSVPELQVIRQFPIRTAFTLDVSFCSRRSTLLSAGLDGQLVEWDVETGDNRTIFSLPGIGSSKLASAPNGLVAIAGYWDNTLTLLQTPENERVASVVLEHGIYQLVFSPNSELLYVACDAGFNEAGIVTIYQTSPFKEVHRFQVHSSSVSCLALSADGNKLLTGCLTTSDIKIWDTRSLRNR
jgi:WD40 repeat protein